MSKFSLLGPTVYTETGTSQDGLTVIDGKISALNADKSVTCHEFPSNWHIIPGMIDMHIHGTQGADVMDASKAALDTLTTRLPSLGTTAFLATTMSEPVENIEAALKNIADYDNTKGAEILGVHLEGPFISEAYKGAQDGDAILTPDIELFKEWQALANNAIKLVTIAPELDQAIPLIRYLKSQDIIISVGHSNASFDQTNEAIAAGCSHATHLFNAMGKMQHRDPGTAGALLLADQVMAELIADTHHVHPAMLNLTYRLKGKDRVVLVSDAIRARCLSDGEYDLGGQAVILKDNQVRLKHGNNLAGSIITQLQAAKNMQQATDCNLHDLIALTATNPAKALNIYHRKGSLTTGKDADILILNENLELQKTITRGQLT